MDDADLVDRVALRRLRGEVGTGLPRLLAYFHEDGLKSVAALEGAVRAGQAAAMVIPAHTLKGEALQFGAVPLGMLAETIEHAARRCVECQTGPEALVPDVLQLRPLFQRTVAVLGLDGGTPAAPVRPVSVVAPAPAPVPALRQVPPLAPAAGRPVFGRKAPASPAR